MGTRGTRSFARRATVAAAAAAVACAAVFSLTAMSSSADTTQTNAWLGVTGTFSDFAVPITGTATPNPVTVPNTITLNNTSVAISVNSTLIGAGVITGLVQAADNLADLGVTD